MSDEKTFADYTGTFDDPDGTAPPKPPASMRASLEKKDDWHGVCSECGEVVTGTPSQIREHGKTCGKDDG